MTKFEHKVGTASLFKNDKKTEANQPDYVGSGMDLQGTPMRLAAWIKEGAKGKFFSFKFTPVEMPQNTLKIEEAAKVEAAPDDLPF
jgi:hypothetical protein